MRLFGRDAQLGDRRVLSVTAGEAMTRGVLKNQVRLSVFQLMHSFIRRGFYCSFAVTARNAQTLAYFMARTTQFLTRIGVRPDWLRMRQVLAIVSVRFRF